MSRNRTLWPLLGLLAFALPTLTLPVYGNNGETILIVSDFNAPVSMGGPAGGRHDDDKLVYYLGAGDPATPGFVDFGNGVPGDPNEVNLIPSLGYTVDVTGMGGAMRDSESPWHGGLPTDPFGSLPQYTALHSADLILVSYVKTSEYTANRYRDADDPFLTVAESWNGIQTPLLSLGNGDIAIGSGRGDPTPIDPGPLGGRFGWNEAANFFPNPLASNMQIQPDMITHPFFQGLSTTPDPEVPGGVEVQLNDWTYTSDLLSQGYANGAAPPAASNGVNRGIRVVRRDPTDPSQGRAGDGPVPGATITSGYGDAGGYIVDYAAGTDFNVFKDLVDYGDFDEDTDTDGVDFLEWQRTLGDADSLDDWEDNFGATGLVVGATNVAQYGGEFGVAGARRVNFPMWGYSIPIVDPTGDHTWGQYQTTDFFRLVDNVIKEMLLNPNGAPAVSAGTAVVPEPSSMALVVVSALAIFSGSRRRRQFVC